MALTFKCYKNELTKVLEYIFPLHFELFGWSIVVLTFLWVLFNCSKHYIPLADSYLSPAFAMYCGFGSRQALWRISSNLCPSGDQSTRRISQRIWRMSELFVSRTVFKPNYCCNLFDSLCFVVPHSLCEFLFCLFVVYILLYILLSNKNCIGKSQ